MTCRKIYFEFGVELYKSSFFAVQTVQHTWDPIAAVFAWNRHLFDTRSRSALAVYIRNLDFMVNLAPKISIRMHVSYLHALAPPSSIPIRTENGFCRVKLDERFSSYRYQVIFEHLSRVQQKQFPHLKLISLAVKLHFRTTPKTPCIQAFSLYFRLNPDMERSREIPTALEENLQLDHLNLESNRSFLRSLGGLETLDRVDLVRHWCIWRQTQERIILGKRQFIKRESRYRNLASLLQHAGPNYTNFLQSPMDLNMIPRSGKEGDVEYTWLAETTFYLDDRV